MNGKYANVMIGIGASILAISLFCIVVFVTRKDNRSNYIVTYNSGILIKHWNVYNSTIGSTSNGYYSFVDENNLNIQTPIDSTIIEENKR